MNTDTLLAILRQPSTIRFLRDSADPDLMGINMSKNPQRSPGNSHYAWYLADRQTEVPITFVGKLTYSGLGDKTGPYFSIPGDYVSIFRFTCSAAPCH